MNDANVSFGLFEPKTEYFGGRIRLVTCSETNKAGNGPNQPRPGRFYLYKDIHERLKAMDGGYAFCVKNTLGDVVLFKTVKIQDSPLLKDAKFSRKGFFTVNWNDIFPEMHSRGNPSPKKQKDRVKNDYTKIRTCIC